MSGMIHSQVYVDRPGYRVDAYVTYISPGRKLLRGPKWNHLSVSHINKPTNLDGATGAEGNDTPQKG